MASRMGCSSVGRASDCHVTDAGLIPWCSKEFSSQSQLSVQTLFRCLYTVQSHALTPVHMLKIMYSMSVFGDYGNINISSMHHSNKVINLMIVVA